MNKFVVQTKKYWWGVLGVVVILGLMIGLVILVNTEEAQEIEVASEVIEEVEDVEEGVRFSNAEFVRKFVGETGAEAAVADIEEGVAEFLGEGSYVAFAAGSDVEKGVSFPFETLEFVLQVAEEDLGSSESSENLGADDSSEESGAARNFEVVIALMKDAYFGVLVGPTEGEEARLFVEYLRPGAEAGYEEGEAMSKLQAWAAGMRPGVEILE